MAGVESRGGSLASFISSLNKDKSFIKINVEHMLCARLCSLSF